MAPTYRQRLRIEGATLAACGIAGSALLLATTDEARRGPWNTVAQLAAVVAIAAVLARRGANRSLRDAREVAPGDVGDGRPTALWKLPATVAVLAAIFPLLREAGVPGAGWDASLRITGGSAIVGLVQALLIEWIVAAWEGERGVRYYRSKGSRGLRTVLVFAPRH